MEGLPKESLKLAYAVDSDALKYISGLSTILVATIQEAKDKISQIEYIFCTQLYQHFEFNSNGLQKKDVEDSCKDKESEIEKLKLDMKHTLEQNHLLQAEKEKLKEEYEEKVRQQCTKLTRLECRIDELETELISKSQEVDEGVKLQKKLHDLVQAKGSALVDLDKQLRECETRASMLLADLNCQERKAQMLQDEHREKTEECELGKELRSNLLEKLESQAIRIMKNEELFNDCNKEKEQLLVGFAELKENFVELSNELRRKTVEADEARKRCNELLEQIDLSMQVILRNEKQMENHEKEKELLLTNVRDLEDKVNKLQLRLGERCSETFEESDLYKKLLQQIESKSVELMAEKKKNRNLFDSYKRLKSQYNFLLRKSGLTEENMKSPSKLEDQNTSVRHHHGARPLSDIQTRIPDIPATVSDVKTVKDEICSDDNMKDRKEGKSAQSYRSHSPGSNIYNTHKSHSSPKSDPIAGRKHPASGWRGTRSSECRGGTDLHDDFLDTPQENIIGKLRKIMKEETGGLAFPVLEDRTADSSDDETEDMNIEQGKQKQQTSFETGDKRGFKYVEPVRKRAEREKLKGYECKQCKKFYDAVLDKRGKDGIVDKHDFRCEHHDGVSRHRYRYAPPLTPEGFWNIGFESEM